MAHFAKLDTDNVVLNVLVVNNSDMLDENGQESEAVGIQFLQNLEGWQYWKQTSYNTKEGVYYDPNTNLPASDQSKAFRANFAGIGMVYDAEFDIFRQASKPFPSWILNTTKGIYEAPVPEPEPIKNIDQTPPLTYYIWNESTQVWELPS
jgi:hypothetical protein